MKDYKPFQFKQFSIQQNHAAMKVGTDSILLGSWATIHRNEYVLDIGAGTGILSIMLAQKVDGHCSIDAIEIDNKATTDAQRNIMASPWHKSIHLIHEDFRTFQCEKTYDIIISNPPYYSGDTSPNQARSIARSTQKKLDIKVLLAKSSQLLKKGGRLYLIFPYELMNKVTKEAKATNLFAKSYTSVFPNPTKSANRVLIEFISEVEQGETTQSELTIYDHQNQYTREYKLLTKAFYLNH